MEDTSKVIEMVRKIVSIDPRRLWMIHDENFHAFFDWFAKIDDDNLITETLLKDYDEVRRSGTVYSEKDADAQLMELNKDYANILDYTDRDVEVLEQELEQLVEIEEQYEQLLEGAKETDMSLTKELCELERKQMEAQYMTEKSHSGCLDLANQLEDLYERTQQQFTDLHDCYLRRQNPPLFVYQMPIEQFDTKCDQFLKYLEMYVKKHFTVKRLDGSKLSEEHDNFHVISELESIKMRLDAEEFKLLEAKREYAGVKHLVHRLQDPNWVSMKVPVLKKKCVELRNANEQDILRVELLKNELEMLIKHMNELKIESVLFETNRVKLERAISRLEYIERLDASISKELMNAELLWILMQLDLERMRECFDNADEMNGESKKCFKRIDAMKLVEKNAILEEAYSDYLMRLSALVRATGDNVATDETSIAGIKTCLQHFSNLSKRITKQCESVANGKYQKKVNDMLDALTNQEQMLQRFVFDGPLSCPQFYDQEYLERVQALSYFMGQLERDCRNLRKDFVQNIEEPKQSKKFELYKRRLWIWFLTEPKKVVIAIKEITAEASKSASYKGISGIKRKSMENELKF
ncbi:augmin complex subunit dgt3 [Anopheles cruzii]|uniref:augmin complex subunit dgt3 n=1 Tax=Anopheles cruzii TaxID=68878 RepID=UPI0022EC5573|nr:augmin complex subunit dgt3 [Anopheles cruzii]